MTIQQENPDLHGCKDEVVTASLKGEAAELLIRAVSVLAKLSPQEREQSRLVSLLNLALACAAEESEQARESLKTHGPTGFNLGAQQKALQAAVQRQRVREASQTGATAPAGAQHSEGELAWERAQILAQGIRDAAIKAGIIHSEALPSGTQLLLILDEMADFIAAQNKVLSSSLH